MSTKTGSKDDLSLLHQLTTKQFLEILQNGEVVVDKDGEPHRITPTAAMMGQIIKFLKDNNIDCDPKEVPEDHPLRNLAASLPFPTRGDDDGVGYQH